jgi:hypothetical protein
MTALGAPKSVPRKPEINIERAGVKATITVYTGANLVWNSGYLQPAAGLASLPYAGVAREGTVITSAVDGAREVDFQASGRVEMPMSGATVADICKEVWMTDDNVITTIPNNGPPMGKILNLKEAGIVVIDITGYTARPNVGPLHITIPFSTHASDLDSGYDLPSRMLVEKVEIEIVTPAAGTIDVGLGMGTETGYDADGLVDGEDTTSAGMILPIMEDAVSANITLGALLNAGTIRADVAGNYAAVKKDHYAGSLVTKSISYTSTSAAAGFIHVIGRMI